MNAKIDIEQAESSSSASRIPSLDSATSSPSSFGRKSSRGIKEPNYNFGKDIHFRYKKVYALSSEELKAMKCGLSCILDLSEGAEGVTISVLGPEVWSRLIEKYKKVILTVPTPDQSLKEKWEYIAESVVSENSTSTAEKYTSFLRSKSDISTEKKDILDFFSNILFLIDSNKFMLDPSIQSKVSERDFAYQIWLPLLKKLFHINGDLVRLKIGETVLSGSTHSKSELYPSHDKIIGFKVDIRIIFDYKMDEFDIVCGEACVPLPGQSKLEHDMSKLLREGKLIQTTLQSIIIDPKDSISWMLLIIPSKVTIT